MSRTYSLSLQIAFFIIMILGLALFFGAYALMVPALALYVWGALTFGQWRIRRGEMTLAEARAAGLNRFGLADLPRFYGFLTVLWWLVPPVLLLLLYRTFGTPLIDGMLERETLTLMGQSIDNSALHQFARSVLSATTFGGESAISALGAAEQSSLEGLQAYFQGQHPLRRLFWFALLMAAIALWLAGPREFPGMRGRLSVFVMAMIGILVAILSGYAAAAIPVLLVLAFMLLSPQINAMMSRIAFMATGIALLLFLRDILDWGQGGYIVSAFIILGSAFVLFRQGVLPRLDDNRFLLVVIGLVILILTTVVTWIGAYSWLFDFGSEALFEVSPGNLGLQAQKLLNSVDALREGGVVKGDDMAAAAERVLSAQNIYRYGYFVVLALGVAVGVIGSVFFIRPTTFAQAHHERAAGVGMILASAAAILVTIGIVLALLSNAEFFFTKYPIEDFLFGLHWSKDAPIREDQAGGFNLGAVPVFYGTLVVSFVALTVALPIGLMSAIYMAEYAGPRVRGIFKPILEVLAGIPTIVYGVFALRSGIPFAKDLFDGLEFLLELRWLPVMFHLEYLDFSIGAKSAVVAGSVMGIMLIPFISSLSDDALKAVPRSLRDGSLALGGNKSETILKVLIPAALPGIMGGFLLATSRAIGETMIVVLAAGGQANLTLNILDQMTTVTVQITELLIGDAEFDRANTLSVFGLGLVLFVSTLLLNLAAIQIVRRYRQRYS